MNGYQYRAEFANTAGHVDSNAAVLAVYTVPSAPAPPTAAGTTVKGAFSVTLTWIAPFNGNAAITDYQIKIYTYIPATKKTPASYTLLSTIDTKSTNLSYVITSLKSGSWAFTIAACNAVLARGRWRVGRPRTLLTLHEEGPQPEPGLVLVGRTVVSVADDGGVAREGTGASCATAPRPAGWLERMGRASA
jgi:hypothetical protein